MKESLIKYLAGLLDADGCLCLQFRRDRVKDIYFTGLQLNLDASSEVDKKGFVAGLPALTGMGFVSFAQGTPFCKWGVARRADLERLLPRIIKHMVIKAKHWQWVLDTWRAKRGTTISPEERDELRKACKESRAFRRGPLKPKNHPTWAWLAGYLDGDGWYRFKCYTTDFPRWMIRCGVLAHKNDAAVLTFLQKSFGGSVRQQGSKTPHLIVWDRNLGASERSFALRFLPNVAKHARIKKPIIDQIISYHQQRLSPLGPTG